MSNVFYFVADEGDGLYNVFSYADFNTSGYYDGHEGEDGYHINDFDIVFRSAHWNDCVRWVDEHKEL